MKKLKTNCYLCREKRECTEIIIYEKNKDKYNKVYICSECYKKRYGKI